MGPQQDNNDSRTLQDLNRKLAACKKHLQAERATIQTLRNKQADTKKEIVRPLSRSSLEAYTGIAIGIVLAVLPMTYWLRCILFLVLGVVGEDFVWRSPITYKWPTIVKTLLAISMIIGIGWVGWVNVSGAYQREMAPPFGQYIISYGGLDPRFSITVAPPNPPLIVGIPGCHILVDGSKLTKYATDYNLVEVCLHWYGTQDIYDVTNISKSGAFDIRAGQIQIPIRANEQYIAELERHALAVNYFLLLVPKGVSPLSFTSVQQAINKGAKVLDTGSQEGGG